jgi:hypothetical protein
VSDGSACKEAKILEEDVNFISSLKYNLDGEVILDNDYLYFRLGYSVITVDLLAN